MGGPTISWRVAIALLALVSCSVATEGTITQDELVRNTQELFDAVAAGDKTPWQKYFADDSMYFDEKGKSWDKTSLVNELAPLPTGYSGSIRIVKTQSRIVGNTAILSYDLDESETIFGQELRARYHGTDTWMYRNGKWQIIAGQVFRYYEDPAPGKVDEKLNEFWSGKPFTSSRPGSRSRFPLTDSTCTTSGEIVRRKSSFPKPQISFFARVQRVVVSSATRKMARWMR